MKDSAIIENMKFTGKYEFVEKTGIWPEWSSFLVGVSGGYYAFELDSDGEQFLVKYREAHKDDEPSKYFHNEECENKQTARIGFAA